MHYLDYVKIDRIIEKYKNDGNFSHEQLKQIRKGIEAGINVSEYAKDSISSKEMFNKRWELIIKKYIDN